MKSTQPHLLEDQFNSLMDRLQPRPEITSEFSAIAANVWDAQQKDSEKSISNLTGMLEEQKRLKSELLRAQLRAEVCQSDYEEANREFTREIVEVENETNL